MRGWLRRYHLGMVRDLGTVELLNRNPAAAAGEEVAQIAVAEAHGRLDVPPRPPGAVDRFLQQVEEVLDVGIRWHDGRMLHDGERMVQGGVRRRPAPHQLGRL